MRFLVRLISAVVLLHIGSAEEKCSGDKGGCKLIPDRTTCGIQDYSDKVPSGDTDLAEFPWTALLEYTNDRGEKSFNCGGTLINQRYVLTAAHCTQARGISLKSVRLGEWNISSAQDCYGSGANTHCSEPPVDLAVESVTVHENYRPSSTDHLNDIALLRLEKDVKYTDFIRPICLPTTSDKAQTGQKLTLAGWGTTETSEQTPVKLQVQVKIVSYEECERKFASHHITISDEKQICGSSQNGKYLCEGAGGSSLTNVFADNTSQYYIEGIVSFGPSCGTEGIPDVYTRVSAHLEWILKNVKP